MAQPEELEKLKEAFTPEVTITAFQDCRGSIVAKVQQNYPKLGNTRIFKVIMDRASGNIDSLNRILNP